MDTLLQPIAQKQQSYIKDTTDFISFIENTKIGQDTILVAMDVSSLNTNMPQEEGIEIVCKAYETFHNNDPPIPTHYLKFTAEISGNEITFLDTVVFKGERFIKGSILDIRTHYKRTETFQYTHFTSCHPPGVKRGFIKGEAIRLLRTNSSKTTFEECLANFKRRLEARGYQRYIQLFRENRTRQCRKVLWVMGVYGI